MILLKKNVVVLVLLGASCCVCAMEDEQRKRRYSPVDLLLIGQQEALLSTPSSPVFARMFRVFRPSAQLTDHRSLEFVQAVRRLNRIAEKNQQSGQELLKYVVNEFGATPLNKLIQRADADSLQQVLVLYRRNEIDISKLVDQQTKKTPTRFCRGLLIELNDRIVRGVANNDDFQRVKTLSLMYDALLRYENTPFPQ
jgi:hypothetical protein